MWSVTLPLHPRRDEADARPVVQPSVHHFELGHGRLHAEGDKCRDEKTPTTGEIAHFHHGARRRCSRSFNALPNSALTTGQSSLGSDRRCEPGGRRDHLYLSEFNGASYSRLAKREAIQHEDGSHERALKN
jgi:hypothetical protein